MPESPLASKLGSLAMLLAMRRLIKRQPLRGFSIALVGVAIDIGEALTELSRVSSMPA
jgi:hypothetical protein